MGPWDQFLAKVKEGTVALTGATAAETPQKVLEKVDAAAASFKGAAEVVFNVLEDPPKPKPDVDPELRRLAEEAIDLYQRTAMTATRKRANGGGG